MIDLAVADDGLCKGREPLSEQAHQISSGGRGALGLALLLGRLGCLLVNLLCRVRYWRIVGEEACQSGTIMYDGSIMSFWLKMGVCVDSVFLRDVIVNVEVVDANGETHRLWDTRVWSRNCSQCQILL